jgi:hypothetical protein
MEERAHPLLVAILVALPGCTESYEGEACMNVSLYEDKPCPSRHDVSPDDLSIGEGCKSGPCEIVEVNGEGTRYERPISGPDPQGPGGSVGPQPPRPVVMEAVCCYPVTIVDHDQEGAGATPGRPYYDGGKQRSAPLLQRGSAALAPGARAVAWAQAGAGEHASVAAFSRLVLELMALGAPTALLSEAHQAALDEIRHAETCWEFARSLGLNVEVGAFPFVESLELDVTHEELAAATVRDGCVAETLGALLLDSAARATAETDVRCALEQMAREEARHAVFAYRVVAWALTRGGVRVRAAVREAFESARFEPDLHELALRANVDVEILRGALNQGIAEVLQPAKSALLAA